MAKESFFSSYVAKPVVESRFGWIPVGFSAVSVVDVKAIMASQNVHLDENRLIVVEDKPKENFNKIFDQEVLCIVFCDEEGRVIIDRRSSKGWLSNQDDSATPELIQKYGLKAEDHRFSKAGIGVPSKEKTDSCLNIIDRLCSACGVESPMMIVDTELKIEVVEIEYNGKKNREVKSYHKLDSTQVVAPEKSAPVEDDMPF